MDEVADFILNLATAVKDVSYVDIFCCLKLCVTLPINSAPKKECVRMLLLLPESLCHFAWPFP